MPHDKGEVSPAEVEALFTRLRAEIRAGSSAAPALEHANETSAALRLAARDEAERLWAITAERGVARGPGLKGALAYPVKRALRPFLRWYVEPALVEQRQFNATLLRLIDELTERLVTSERQPPDGDQNHR
ncbi:MAG: hypothetical protein ACR2OD_04760 [Gaiellaceae bacterium]